MVPPDARLLVVDDDPAIREYLTNRLAMEGYNVIEAENADRATEVLKENPDTDLILLDVIMPGPTGFDLLRSLKTDPVYQHIPVIMVTALGLVQDKELAFRLGAGDYLTKPFDTREMLARIHTHISLKQKTDELTHKNQILTTILGTVPGIVYMKDEERKFLHVNHLFEDMCGKKSEEIIGMSDEMLFEPNLAEAFHRSEDLIFSHNIPYLENLEDVHTSSGDTRNIFFRRQPVRNPDGLVKGLVGVGIDLTEQVTLRNILSDQEAFLRTLMNTFPARIWTVDMNERYTHQNSTHIARCGSLIGKSIDDIQAEEPYKREWKRRCQNAMSGNQDHAIYTSDSGGDGKAIISWMLPILQDEKITGVLGISLEVSDAMISTIIKQQPDSQGKESFSP